ncbi:MAG: hypothetical protein WAK55_17950 [Xanthobacteraceae bacterium]
MFEVEVFFENQVKECKSLAERASDKSGREFWLRAAHRWGALLAERRGALNEETTTHDARSISPNLDAMAGSVRLEHPYLRRRKGSYLRRQQRRAV